MRCISTRGSRSLTYLISKNVLHRQDINLAIGRQTERSLDFGADQKLAGHLAQLLNLVALLKEALVGHVAGSAVCAEVDGAV